MPRCAGGGRVRTRRSSRWATAVGSSSSAANSAPPALASAGAVAGARAGSSGGTPKTGSRRDGVRCSSQGGSRESGSRYSAPRNSPQCRHPGAQCEGPGSTVATTWPALTSAPTGSSGRTGSYVVRSGGSPVPVRVRVSTPRPATGPAKEIRPGAAARTAVPGGAARSTPRWPGPYAESGGSQSRTTTGRGGPTGQLRSVESSARAGAVLAQSRDSGRNSSSDRRRDRSSGRSRDRDSWDRDRERRRRFMP